MVKEVGTRALTTREERMVSAAETDAVSEAAKRFLLREFEAEGLPSPTLAAHRLKDLGAGLKGVVSLSAGGQIASPAPETVVAAAKQALDDGAVHSAGPNGLKIFREAAAEKLRRDNGINADPETEIIATIGAQLPIFASLAILVDPGDEVLIMEPEYAAIAPIIRMFNGIPVSVPYTEGEREWQFDVAELERRITDKAVLFIFSNGSNPTGVNYSQADLEAISVLARQHNLMVFADEEYEYINFDGRRHYSIAALPSMKERCITAFSFSKTFSMSGFRIGYMVAPAWVVDYTSDMIRFTIQSCPSVSQYAAIPILKGHFHEWLDETMLDLQKKRDYAVERLNAMPGIKCAIPRGCYFLFPNMRETGLSSMEFAERLLLEERVSVIPGMSFGRLGEGHVRVSGCVGWEGLRGGLDGFERLVRRLS